MATTKKVMHPDVYDTIELMALMDDGIGAGKDFNEGFHGVYEPEYDKPVTNLCPVCVWGAAIQADGGLGTAESGYDANGPVAAELRRLGIYRSNNDGAVRETNYRKNPEGEGGLDWANARISFDDWRTELHVERGDAEDFPEYAPEQDSQPAEAVGNDSAN